MFIIILISLVITRINAKLFVTFSFDDGTLDHNEMSKIMDSYGMKGTFHINSGRIDSSTRLSKNSIQDMYNRGHEIGGHTVNHANLRQSSTSKRRKEVCDDFNTLENIGTDVSSFAYPYSSTFSGSENLLKSCGYTNGRISGGIQTDFNCNGCPIAIELPPTESYFLRSITYRLSYGISLFTKPILSELNTLDADDKYYWIILVLHEISDDAETYTAMKKSDFIYLLDTLKDHPEIAVVRTEDIMNAPSSGQSEYYESIYTNFVNRFSSSSPSSSTSTSSSITTLNNNTQTDEFTTNDATTTTEEEGSTTSSGIWIGVSIGSVSIIGLIIILLVVKNKHKDKDDTKNEVFGIPQEIAKTDDDIEKQFGVTHDISMSKEAEYEIDDQSDIIVVFDEADVELYSMEMQTPNPIIQTSKSTNMNTEIPITQTPIQTPIQTPTTPTTQITTQSDIIIDPDLIAQLETHLESDNETNSENSNRIVLEYISDDEGNSI
jgi:peptidoglycan/xylan/chitin deacetylase (PgdA/CDA1 family)